MENYILSALSSLMVSKRLDPSSNLNSKTLELYTNRLLSVDGGFDKERFSYAMRYFVDEDSNEFPSIGRIKKLMKPQETDETLIDKYTAEFYRVLAQPHEYKSCSTIVKKLIDSFGGNLEALGYDPTILGKQFLVRKITKNLIEEEKQEEHRYLGKSIDFPEENSSSPRKPFE